MRLSQTVLTALVATTATALPVTEKQPQVGTGQQQQQVSPDHDRVQAQKMGGLEENVRKQPLGFTDKDSSPGSTGKQWENVEVEKNSGSMSDLFTTNGGQKKALGWSKIKSALSRGNSNQGNKYSSSGNRQHGNTDFGRNPGHNAGIQARHSPDMSFTGEEEYSGQHSVHPFTSEYNSPRGLKNSGGGPQKVDMVMPMARTSPEREQWMPGHGNREWVRHGEERMISKFRGERQGQDEFSKMSPMDESWDARHPEQQEQQIQGNSHTKGERMVPERVPFTYDYKMRTPWSQEEQKAKGQSIEYSSKSQPTGQYDKYLDYQPSTSQTGEFFKDQPGVGRTKEHYFKDQPIVQTGISGSYVHATNDVQEARHIQGEYQKVPTEQNMQKNSPFEGEYMYQINPIKGEYQKTPFVSQETNYRGSPTDEKEFQKTQPMSQGMQKDSYQFQASPSMKGEYQKTQPMSQNTQKGPYQQGEFQKAQPMSQNREKSSHSEGEYHQTNPPMKGEYQKTQPVWQETDHRGSPVNIERRNRHLGQVNEMSHNGKPSHSDDEYLRPQTRMKGENSQAENTLFNKDIRPTHENMVKSGQSAEARGMVESYEQGRKVPMHEESVCNARFGDTCENFTKGKDSGVQSEMKTVTKPHDSIDRFSQRPGRVQEETCHHVVAPDN